MARSRTSFGFIITFFYTSYTVHVELTYFLTCSYLHTTFFFSDWHLCSHVSYSNALQQRPSLCGGSGELPSATGRRGPVEPQRYTETPHTHSVLPFSRALWATLALSSNPSQLMQYLVPGASSAWSGQTTLQSTLVNNWQGKITVNNTEILVAEVLRVPFVKWRQYTAMQIWWFFFCCAGSTKYHYSTIHLWLWKNPHYILD